MKKNLYYYIGANPTCDLVIMNHEGKFLLIKRSEVVDTCPDMWAFAGGFVDTNAKRNEPWLPGLETPEEAAKRETKEEANLDLDKDVKVYEIGVYEGNNRDPRDNDIAWSQSHAFFTILEPTTYFEQIKQLKGQSDAKEIDFFTIEEIQNMNLAFDHNRIFLDALEKYKDKIEAVINANSSIKVKHKIS